MMHNMLPANICNSAIVQQPIYTILRNFVMEAKVDKLNGKTNLLSLKDSINNDLLSIACSLIDLFTSLRHPKTVYNALKRLRSYTKAKYSIAFASPYEYKTFPK